jgi:hypothetical protein
MILYRFTNLQGKSNYFFESDGCKLFDTHHNICFQFVKRLTVMNFLEKKRERERESQVQPVSSSFGYHEWCLKANAPAHTVVYVRHSEPSAVSFLSNKLHKLYIVPVPHLFFKHAVDSFPPSCRFVPWLALLVCWYGISALFK